MAWIAAVASLAGGALASNSGGGGFQPSRNNAVTSATGDLLGISLPEAIAARTNAINQGTGLQVAGIQNGLNVANGFFGQANGTIGAGVNQGLGFLSQGANDALGFLNPLVQVGDAATGVLADIARDANDPNHFNFDENDPAFQFIVNQGNRAINAGGNARGLLNSGGRLRELAEFGQDRANIFRGDEIRNRVNILNARQSAVNPLFNAGVNARNNSSGISNALGQNSSNLVFNGANSISNNLVQQAGLNFGGLSSIGEVQANGLLNAGNSTIDGLLNQINGFNNLSGVQNGVAAQNLQIGQLNAQRDAQTAQAIGTILGALAGSGGSS